MRLYFTWTALQTGMKDVNRERVAVPARWPMPSELTGSSVKSNRQTNTSAQSKICLTTTFGNSSPATA